MNSKTNIDIANWIMLLLVYNAEEKGLVLRAVVTWKVSQNDIVIGISLFLQIIREQYYIQQSALLESLEGRAVDVAGDGRCDSPGHNALFGMYSLMDVTSKKILTLHVLKVKTLIIFVLHPYLAIWFNYHLISKNRNFAMPSSSPNKVYNMKLVSCMDIL